MKQIKSILLFLFLPLFTEAQVDLAKLDAYFAKALRDWNVPGMAIAIVKDDKIVFEKGYGVREVGKTERVDEHTLFAVASNSKSFTAAALAILVDEKKISWDDRVQSYLPYFQLYDPYVSAETRVRDLLSHRVGLGTYSGDLLWYGTPYNREEVVRRVRYLKQAYPFRAGYGYSNVMFVAAGEVIAKVYGKPWEEVVREKFLIPLGMKNTITSIRELTPTSNAATPHGEVEGKIVTFPWYNWDVMGAAGAIISSVHDMSQWLRLHMHHGTFEGKRIFSEEQSWTMWTPHNMYALSPSARKQVPHRNFSGYGLGWGLYDYRSRFVATHSGGYDGMFSRMAVVPSEKLGIVILTNSMTSISEPLVYRVLDAYLGGEEKDWSAEALARFKQNKQRELERRQKEIQSRVANTKPSLSLASYTGTYGGPLYGNAEVKLENGSLVLRLLPNPELVADLSHWHYDVFEIKWRKRFPWFGNGKAQFLMDASRKVIEMKLDVPNEDFWFHELEFKRLD